MIESLVECKKIDSDHRYLRIPLEKIQRWTLFIEFQRQNWGCFSSNRKWTILWKLEQNLLKKSKFKEMLGLALKWSPVSPKFSCRLEFPLDKSKDSIENSPLFLGAISSELGLEALSISYWKVGKSFGVKKAPSALIGRGNGLGPPRRNISASQKSHRFPLLSLFLAKNVNYFNLNVLFSQPYIILYKQTFLEFVCLWFVKCWQ